MKKPNISLGEAWEILGRDPNRILSTLKAVQGQKARLVAIDAALTLAKKIGKSLLAKCHPDKNPNDKTAHNKFLRIQSALDAISFYTEDIKMKSISIEEKKSVGFLVIRKN